MNREEIAQEALVKAVTNESLANYETIINGFVEKGISADEITPRVNVFTFHAWRALGRTVRKGEHGVKILTIIPCEKTDRETGEKVAVRKPKSTTVFHISQTDELTAPELTH